MSAIQTGSLYALAIVGLVVLVWLAVTVRELWRETALYRGADKMAGKL